MVLVQETLKVLGDLLLRAEYLERAFRVQRCVRSRIALRNEGTIELSKGSAKCFKEPLYVTGHFRFIQHRDCTHRVALAT